MRSKILLHGIPITGGLSCSINTCIYACGGRKSVPSTVLKCVWERIKP
ncbi:hypothetical protein [Edaphocola aurantiacus]